MSDTASGALSGAGQGAATRAMFGPWGAAIGAGVGAISGWLGSKSSKKAAEQQRQAIEQAKQFQTGLRGDMQNRLTPYLSTGSNAANLLNQGLTDGSLTRSFTNEDFVKDPGYQWRMDQGTKAVEGGAAARGGLLSGAAAKALTKYGQGYASNEFNNAYSRFTNDQDRSFNKIFGTSGLGLNATGQANSVDTNYGNNMMGLMTGAGNAQAAGTMGSANAIAGGIGQMYNAYQDNALMNFLKQGGSGGGTAGGNIASQYGSGAWRSPWAGYGGNE